MPKIEYEHVFIQHITNSKASEAAIPIDIASGLNAWGADGWDVVHMEAVWAWHQEAEGKSWPEQLLGYYVTFKRSADATGGSRVASATAAVPREAHATAHRHQPDDAPGSRGTVPPIK